MAFQTADSRGNVEVPSPAYGKELCLLSLDGGGVRGLSTLLILKQLMELIDPQNPPKPCDYFDMIGGTSTGGLIALMLGRMQLTVDECIAAYSELSPRVFTKLHHRVKLPSGETQGRFNHEALEQQIKQLLGAHDMDPDSLLKDSKQQGACKTFVCATSQQTGRLAILSSYYNERRGSDMLQATRIWEAARATSAATTFFDPITVNDETFVDGATGANNPINSLWTEAGDIWGAGDGLSITDVQCIVSIGTGSPSLTAFGPSLRQVGKALKAVATETEETADFFYKKHTKLFQHNQAFRFNVSTGLETIGLEDVSKWQNIKAATRLYIQKEDTFLHLKKCAANLREREWIDELISRIVNYAQPSIAELKNPVHHRSPGELLWLTNTHPFVYWGPWGRGRPSQALSLWYRTPLNLRARNRSCVAAATAALPSIWHAKIDPEDPEMTANFSRVLYFQCIPDYYKVANPANLDDMRVSASDILLSFACQALLLFSDNLTSLRTQILSLPEVAQTVIRTALTTANRFPLGQLIMLLHSVLASDHPAMILAIDNIHAIDPSHVRELFIEIMELMEPLYPIRLMITGAPTPALLPVLGLVPFVSDDTEYEECMQSLYFPQWNTRRDQVVDADPGTNHWLWQHEQYLKWTTSNNAVLWINGKPGSGKSVLAKSLQRRFSSQIAGHSPELAELDGQHRSSTIVVQSKLPVVVDWFYSTRLGKVGMSHSSLLRSILYQSLSQDREMFEIVKPYYRASPLVDPLSFPDAPSWCNSPDFAEYHAQEILEKISSNETDLVCVIDAMDEAENSGMTSTKRTRTLLGMLSDMMINVRGSKIKLVVLSRPDPLIELDFSFVQRKLPAAFRILLEDENRADIELLIERGLGRLRRSIHTYDSDQESLDSSTSDPPLNQRKLQGFDNAHQGDLQLEVAALEGMRSYLKEHAKGVILWVTLILRDLEETAANGLSSLPTLEARLRSLPVELDKLYAQIISKLEGRLRPEELARTRQILEIIGGAAALGRPISIRELWEAIAVPTNIEDALRFTGDPIATNRAFKKSWVGFRRQLRRNCGLLIEVIPADISDASIPEQDLEVRPDDTVHFIHRTVKDFLQGRDGTSPLYFSELDAMQRVKDLAKNYMRIAFSEQQTTYAPFIKKIDTNQDWQTMMRGIVDYLQQKLLLGFSTAIMLTDSASLRDSLGLSLRIFDYFINPPRYDWDRFHDDLFGKETKFYRRHAENSEIGRAAFLQYLFSYACNQGYKLATANLLTILQLLYASQDDLRIDYMIAVGALRVAIRHDLHLNVRNLMYGFQHYKLHKQSLNIHKPDCNPFITSALKHGSVNSLQYIFTRVMRSRTRSLFEPSNTPDNYIPEAVQLYTEALDKVHTGGATREGQDRECETSASIEDIQKAINMVIRYAVPESSMRNDRLEEPETETVAEAAEYLRLQNVDEDPYTDERLEESREALSEQEPTPTLNEVQVDSASRPTRKSLGFRERVKTMIARARTPSKSPNSAR